MYEFAVFVDNSIRGNITAKGVKNETEYKRAFANWYERRMDCDSNQVGHEHFYVTDRFGRVVFEDCD